MRWKKKSRVSRIRFPGREKRRESSGWKINCADLAATFVKIKYGRIIQPF